MNVARTGRGPVDAEEVRRHVRTLRTTGGFRRAHALKALSAAKCAQSTRAIAEAFADSTLTSARDLEPLKGLAAPDSIDAVCEVWDRTKHPLLTEVMSECRYVASRPIGRRIETALKAERYDIVESVGSEAVKWLLAAEGDRDRDVASRASVVLAEHADVYADELCRLAVDDGNRLAALVAASAGASPKDPDSRTAFYFLTNQWERYTDLDLDGSILRRVYERAPQELRQRFAEHARENGRLELVDLAVGGRRGAQISTMTNADWSAVRSVISANHSYDEAWRLVLEAPALASRQLLLLLGQAGWHPKPDEEKIFDDLLALAAKCPGEAPATFVSACDAVCRGSLDIVTASPSGALLAACGFDGNIRVWRSSDGSVVAKLATGVATPCPFTLTDEVVVAHVGERLLLWRRPFDTEPMVIDTEGGGVVGVATSADSRFAVLLRPSDVSPSTLSLWDLDRRALVSQASAPGAPSLARFSPDGRRLSVLFRSSRLDLLQVPELTRVARQGVDVATQAVFTAESRYLVAGTPLDGLAVMRAEDGGAALAVPEPQRVFGLSPDGERAYIGCPEGGIDVRRLSDSRREAPIPGAASSLALDIAVLHADQDIVLAILGDRSLAVYATLPTPKEIARYSVSAETRIVGLHDSTFAVYNGDVLVLFSLEPAHLSSVPLANVSEAALSEAVARVGQSTLFESGDAWVAFISALMRRRQQFDIELEDSTGRVSVGCFDIEIEG